MISNWLYHFLLIQTRCEIYWPTSQIQHLWKMQWLTKTGKNLAVALTLEWRAKGIEMVKIFQRWMPALQIRKKFGFWMKFWKRASPSLTKDSKNTVGHSFLLLSGCLLNLPHLKHSSFIQILKGIKMGAFLSLITSIDSTGDNIILVFHCSDSKSFNLYNALPLPSLLFSIPFSTFKCLRT